MASPVRLPFAPAARALVALAGLLGAAGVALAAMAAHGSADQARLLGQASTMCLAHAPLVLVLAGLDGRLPMARFAGLVAGVGAALFALDLVVRAQGGGLFAMAAPVGGFAMIAGWLVVVVGALVGAVRPS
jgi:uncharacterized membrane protein YgdD (TMEM256/DUF423 family)